MTWKPNSPIPVVNPRKSPSDPWKLLAARCLAILTLLLPLTLIGCAAPPEHVDASLPPPPQFAPASVPRPRAGEPLVLICAREQAGRLENEAVIHSWERWYQDIMR